MPLFPGLGVTGLFGITKESWTSGCVCSMPTFAGVGGNNMGLRQIEIFLRKGAGRAAPLAQAGVLFGAVHFHVALYKFNFAFVLFGFFSVSTFFVKAYKFFHGFNIAW